MPSSARRSRQFCCLCAAAALTGCVADRPAKPDLRAPGDLQPRSVVIATYPLLDDDNNGYPDTIPVVVYLWDDRYPLPMWAEGVFRFELTDDAGRQIAQWHVPADLVQASRRRDQVGAAHQMTLDIRDATTDVRPRSNARLSGEFVGADGGVAKCGRPLGIQIGA